MSKAAFLSTSIERKLRLVQVLCRHGDRAPLRETCYPKDPLKDKDYYPLGNGCLTNKGKMEVFSVGTALRTRYGSYLGDCYYPPDIEVISSDTERTKTTAMLLCGGLYPPPKSQQWHESMHWQTIPYSYTHFMEDKLLIGPLERSPKFRKLFNAVVQGEYGNQILAKHCADLVRISEHTGYENISIRNVYKLFQLLKAEESMGFELPEWTKEYYPKKIMYLAAYEYIMETYDIEMMRHTGGTMAKRVVTEAQAIMDGTSKKKIIIYAGHETSVAYQLRILDIFEQAVPPLAAYIIWELWEIHNKYFIRILYQNYANMEPAVMRIKGEADLCPWEDYFRKMKSTFPDTNTCEKDK